MVELGFLLREVTRLHAQLQRTTVDCCRVTPTECLVLTELGRSGSQSLADLTRRLEVDKGWLSRVVEGMVSDGLVAKGENPGDRRAILVSLTDDGDGRCCQINDDLDDLSSRVMGRIPAAERAGVERALELLHAALLEESQVSPQECC
ncbi:MAG: MarR family transcriptional regulator [Anaerolineae bacterium]|nr:MarR family transcriptional regulator [Anaerolineae bacterium]